MKKYVSLILGAILLISFTLSAQPEKGGMGMGPRAGLQKFKALLKLTPDQEKQIQDLRYQHQKAVIDIRSQIQKNRLELRKMVSENNIDEKKIFQLTDDNSKLQGDLKHSAVKNMLDVYKLLNDDQRAIFVKNFGKLANHKFMKERMKHFGMGKGGMKQGE